MARRVARGVQHLQRAERVALVEQLVDRARACFGRFSQSPSWNGISLSDCFGRM